MKVKIDVLCVQRTFVQYLVQNLNIKQESSKFLLFCEQKTVSLLHFLSLKVYLSHYFSVEPLNSASFVLALQAILNLKYVSKIYKCLLPPKFNL